ncbi:MAG: hypothetical protein Q7W45_05540 [Bacteroidota bacterium]|nr:hypothetical protein [Bacteroidota bacterium]MDP3144910.1 hypothetical protein [Bacteroidota bacterium]MDP3557077.1 hypothetical protein [Bacteroidota bacterium]
MKSLFKSIAVLGLLTITIVSCKKTVLVTPNESKSELVEVNGNVRVPSLVSTNNLIRIKAGQESLIGTFDTYTSAYYPGTLYAHYSASAAGPWSNGVLPVSWVTPKATYVVSPAYPLGTTVYLFYSTSMGTTYPSGSATAIYSTVVM